MTQTDRKKSQQKKQSSAIKKKAPIKKKKVTQTSVSSTKNHPKKKKRKQQAVVQKAKPKRKRPSSSDLQSKQPKKRKQPDEKKIGTLSAKKKKKKMPKKKKRLFSIRLFFLEICLSIGIVSFFIWVLSLTVFTFFPIRGYGMMPTLADKDVVFVNRLEPIKRFSLVLIQQPGKKEKLVRRVIGLPGEEVRYQDDQLFVNNREVTERFIANERQEANDMKTLFTQNFTLQQLLKEPRVPEGKYFVLGDNRPYSTDSRYYGWIDEKEIIGVVKMRVLPLHQMEQFYRQ